jgi:SET domain-containing protein
MLSKPVARPRPFDVRRSPIHGTGAFANRAIRKGERIIEYKGERIPQRVADRRYPDPEEGKPHHTFLFEVDDRIVVDAAHGGNAARFINHSCNPNCEAVIEDGRIFIEAIRPIRPGQELAYDYQFVLEERHTPALKRLYPCHCGARSCRGTILIPKNRRR